MPTTIEAMKQMLSQVQASFAELEEENATLSSKLEAISTMALGQSRGTKEVKKVAPAPKASKASRVVKLGQEPHKGGARRKLDDEGVARLVEAYNNREESKQSVKDIAKDFKISPFTVYGLLKKQGVEVRAKT